MSATETDSEKVVRLSQTAARKAVEGRTRRGFTITKFGRHEDGYFHARVTGSDGTPVYVHRRYGSWLAPGSLQGRAVMKEVVYDVAVELQRKARLYEKHQYRRALLQRLAEVLYHSTQNSN